MKRLALALALFGAPVAAQVQPMPGNGDARLQRVAYSPDQVVQLQVAPNFQLMVAFMPGERIETIALGDSSAWQVTAGKRGDFLFVKSLQPGTVTNMTVVTDTRTYSFDLVAITGYGASAPYKVEFDYPEDAAKPVAAVEAAKIRYRISGSAKIKPTAVYASGTQTIIEWPAERAMPAVFTIEEGAETASNGEVVDGKYVLAGHPQLILFRLGKAKAVARRTSAGAGR